MKYRTPGQSGLVRKITKKNLKENCLHKLAHSKETLNQHNIDKRINLFLNKKEK